LGHVSGKPTQFALLRAARNCLTATMTNEKPGLTSRAFSCDKMGMSAAILKRVELPQGGAITLYDWMADDIQYGRNLARTDANGNEQWRARPLDPANDFFTQFELSGTDLVAWTWSCYHVAVDVETGTVTTLYFTK
jgi:hypothetical protein